MEISPSSLRSIFRHPDRDDSYCEAPDAFTGGNALTILSNGKEAYPAMLEAISEAKSTIHLESYIIRSDRTGWKFAWALAERARAAVQVRVIYDSVGCLDIAPSYLQFLRNNGVNLLEYRPVAPWRRRWGWSRRDHRKMLVVDGRVGFAGGINIADEFVDPADGGGGWRDTDVRIEGATAHELDRLFRATWFRETGHRFPLEGPPDPSTGPSLVHVAANQEFLYRYRIRQAFLHALKRARERVSIMSAYFIPDRGIRRALFRACARGVKVRVLLPGISDVPAVNYASHYGFSDLLKGGVRIYQWQGPVLHAKTVVIDGLWSAVGSYNMDHRSLLHNLEVNLHILDRDFGRLMEESFERDIAASREITLAEWHRRHWQEKMLERLFYAVRYWL
ncbi:MAG: cardiolipin synthase ClsB [Elusimicrobia bacterium]|nr:cardiolipin synthase ClsB [Elusimicrobiota bacterium]